MRIHASLRTVLVSALVVPCFAGAANAIDLEKLMMPGPVSEPHAKYEGDCSKCHSPFDTGREEALCMFCHEEISVDRAAGKGLHGRKSAAASGVCRACHTEHKGRDHDISALNPSGFDHDETDYPLLGAHRAIDCVSCHPADGETKRREAPSTCYACHEPADRHNGKLGKDCADCHTEERWSTTRFDHGKTKYPLVGKHTDVACGHCHPNEQYKGITTTCVDCHRIDDAHQSNFGTDCATCHTPEGFKSSGSFDHGKETKFALTGRHAEIKCEICHRESAKEVKLPLACHECHQIADVHRGSLGKKCEDCHTPVRWEQGIFDHNKGPRFKLSGGHLQVKCAQCHRTPPKQEQALATCRSCHSKDDVHRGQLEGACADCHNEKSWIGEVFFEHDLARFPLLGLHAALPCEACHASPRFRDTETDCVKCHEKDDSHKSALGPECARCHNPNGWNIWEFDHSTETKFPLNGGHEGLVCKACHFAPVGKNVRTPKDCFACHKRDDSHRGSFGRNCEACHNDKTWKDARIMR